MNTLENWMDLRVTIAACADTLERLGKPALADKLRRDVLALAADLDGELAPGWDKENAGAGQIVLTWDPNCRNFLN